jgi:hypothetical protein
LITAALQVNQGNDMNEVQAQIQALAAVESLTSDIDALYVLDAQAKLLTDKVKHLKEYIANAHGEGTHKGELHSVTVALVSVKGSVDWEALCAKHGISADEQDSFRKPARADIRVSPKK